MPAISVIVPVYQAEKLLPQCVESVLAQTFSDWELLLVDDGSRDGSPALCDHYAAKDHRNSLQPAEYVQLRQSDAIRMLAQQSVPAGHSVKRPYPAGPPSSGAVFAASLPQRLIPRFWHGLFCRKGTGPHTG